MSLPNSKKSLSIEEQVSLIIGDSMEENIEEIKSVITDGFSKRKTTLKKEVLQQAVFLLVDALSLTQGSGPVPGVNNSLTGQKDLSDTQVLSPQSLSQGGSQDKSGEVSSEFTLVEKKKKKGVCRLYF